MVNATEPNDERSRPFQFSLKVLFFIVALIAVAIVSYLNGYHDGKTDEFIRSLEAERP